LQLLDRGARRRLELEARFRDGADLEVLGFVAGHRLGPLLGVELKEERNEGLRVDERLGALDESRALVPGLQGQRVSPAPGYLDRRPGREFAGRRYLREKFVYLLRRCPRQPVRLVRTGQRGLRLLAGFESVTDFC